MKQAKSQSATGSDVVLESPVTHPFAYTHHANKKHSTTHDMSAVRTLV